MTQPETKFDNEDVFPGSPRWYLTRLTQKLLSRQQRLLRLERYALGDHPWPVGDRRYVAALNDLQRKSKTNYIELVIKAVVERMRMKEFRFGDEGEADKDSQMIWNYNNMDYQLRILLNTAATFGEVYGLVSPNTIEPDGEPLITVEDPTLCIIETDPRFPQITLAGLKLWQSDIDSTIEAVLYLPNQIRHYIGPAVTDIQGTDRASLLTKLVSQPSEGGFRLQSSQSNPYGKVPLIRGMWQPAFGSKGRAEAENVLDIQDRINHTVLDRLVIAKSQAYNQRWATGLHKPSGKRDADKPPFNPGADMVWATYEEGAKFGQFEAADISQILESIRDDVGDMAAISQTPATYLMNRMANVSGDTLTQDQSALVSKVRLRFDAMGWFLEQLIKMAFAIKGDTEKSKDPQCEVMWYDPEIRTLAEQADALNKLVTAGVPLEIAMHRLNFTAAEITVAVKKAEEAALKEQQLMETEMRLEADNQIRVEKSKPKPTSNSSGKKGSK